MSLHSDANLLVTAAVSRAMTLLIEYFTEIGLNNLVLAEAAIGLPETFVTIPSSRVELKNLIRNIDESTLEKEIVAYLGEGFICEIDGSEHPFLRLRWVAP